MAKQYPLEIKNTGEHSYQVMSKGHHNPHEFMLAVRAAGYDWPLGNPEHVYLKAVPNAHEGGLYYHRLNKPNKRGAFPATVASEAYGDEQYQTPNGDEQSQTPGASQ